MRRLAGKREWETEMGVVGSEGYERGREREREGKGRAETKN